MFTCMNHRPSTECIPDRTQSLQNAWHQTREDRLTGIVLARATSWHGNGIIIAMPKRL